jgi:general secretion pathway protein D
MKPKLPQVLLRRLAVALIAAASVAPAAAQKPEPVPLSQQAAPDVGQPAAPGQAPAAATPNQMVLNFQAADLQAVIKAISQMTGRNFLLDPRVKGQITIISAKPVNSAAAYQIFVSALKAQGFAVVEGPGNLVKIVPSAEARQHAPVSTADMPGGGEQIVTHVVTVQHTSPSQMVPLLRPLMAPTSQLAAHEPANALLITDYADNVRRLLRIIEKIDQPVSSDVNIITLQHASALDMADMLTRLALPGGASAVPQPGAPAVAGGGDRFSIVPDLRTNSLLVRADNPGRVNQLRSLVGKLDVPATTGGNTRVIYLRNADATKLAEVLRGLVAGEARTQAAAAPTPVAAGLPARTGTTRGAEPSLIQADEATNALVINASDSVYNNLRAVIEKLDVRRAQVYVEALIVEMTHENALQLGVQWAVGGEVGSGTGVAVQNFNNASPSIVGAAVSPATAFAAPGAAGGLTLAFLGKTINVNGREITGLGALARALETGSLGNILSTPNLMTLDNAEAKITVAKNVPFVTGSFAQAIGTPGTPSAVNPFQTIERKDIGLILKIKPQISEGGTVKLDISQEVSSIAATAVAGAVDLVTDKRSIETKVVVDDGDTIVLGGLIQDQSNESEQAVPLLGRIPLLGALFRYRENTTTKTNLMIFLRPVVIRGPDDGFRHTTDRYDYLRAQPLNPQQKDALDRISPRRPAAPPAQGQLGPPSAPSEFAN